MTPYLATDDMTYGGQEESGLLKHKTIIIVQDGENQKKMLLMQSLNVNRFYKFGLSQQLPSSLDRFPLSSIYANMDYFCLEETSYWNQNWIWILILDNFVYLEGLKR